MTESDGAEPRWLTAAEMRTWRALVPLLYRLPTELDAQLQQDCQLSFVEYYALAGLSDRPDHTMRMSELALFANSELSRLSHLIRRLENRGFVRREPDPTDGRYTNAILTDAGYDHLVRSAPSHVARVRELIFDILDADDLRRLSEIADRINARIDTARRPC
jgi:DNA-binding MarR family transcriptional regulator